jgi:nicotinate phosphoribosyltransferase
MIPATVRSILDTDLYKVGAVIYPCVHIDLTDVQLTMQQAVMNHFPEAQAIYRFTLRDGDVYFTRQFVDQFRAGIARL